MARILFVDDSVTSRSLVRRLLEGTGHELIDAESGDDALKILADGKAIDLMLCDFNMPHMDGLQLCKTIRENPKTKDLKIVFLTAEVSPRMKGKGKDLGVLGWIAKPVNQKTLIGMINKVVSDTTE